MAENIDDIDGDYAIEILRRMFKNEESREIQLVAELDQKKFPVHRLVMMSSSNYFRALLGPNFKKGKEEEVTISNIDGPTLRAIIDFCYTGKIQITNDNIMKIIDAASAKELVLIKKKCEQFWNDELNISNCVKMFELADKFSLADLRENSFVFICKLKCDQINAREDFIFQRFTESLYHETTRITNLPDLMKLIHMGKISQPLLRRRAEKDDKPTELSRLEKYNPVSNRWELFRNITITDLIMYRLEFGLVFDKDIIFIIGGNNPSMLCSVDTYLLDKMQLLTRGQIATARARFTPILYNNQIFIFGGWNGNPLKTGESLSLETMAAAAIESMQYERYNYAGVILDGKIYVAGGQSVGESYLCSVECYDPANNKWIKTANMNHPRATFGLAEDGGKLYALGHHKSIESYDPVRDVWTEIGSFDESETVTKAIKYQNEIYVQLKDGRFGKFKTGPNRFLPLRNSPSANCQNSDRVRMLFVN